MLRSAIITAVLGLLVCSTAHVHGACTGFENPVTGTGLTSLNSSLLTSFAAFLEADMITTNATVGLLSSKVSVCLSEISKAETDCVQCLNNSCQKRVNELGCTDVVASTPSAGNCPLGKAVCDIEATASKVADAFVTAGNAIEELGKKVVGEIKKVATQVVSSLKKAANEAANVGKNVVSGIKNTAETVGKAVEKTVVNVGEKIVDGVKTAVEALENAGKEVGKFVKDTVGTIKDALGRRRRRDTEPTCKEFEEDTSACDYYIAQCSSCASFNIGGEAPTAEELVGGVCGAEERVDYANLEKALTRVQDIFDAYQNFVLLAASYNTAGFTATGQNDCVKVTFSMIIEERTLQVVTPVNLFDAATSGPILAEEIYKLLLPVTVA